MNLTPAHVFRFCVGDLKSQIMNAIAHINGKVK